MQTLPLPYNGRETVSDKPPAQEKNEKEAETTSSNNSKQMW